MSQLTPDEARASFRALAVGFRKPEHVVPVGSTEDTTVPGAEGAAPARGCTDLKAAGPFPTVALFHGGGFVIGDLETHDNLARAICRVRRPWRVGGLPACARAPVPVRGRGLRCGDPLAAGAAREFGGDGRLAVAGGSAGGNLSAVVAQQVPGLAAQFLIYPTTDGDGDHPSRRGERHRATSSTCRR